MTSEFQLNTEEKLSVTPSSLSPGVKAALIEQARTWLDGTKLKKGTTVSITEGSITSEITLEHSIIKIDGQVYVLHPETIAKGAQGKIKVLESLADGTFLLVKISYISAKSSFDEVDPLDLVMNEIEILSDAGLSRGKTRRIRPPQAGLCKAQKEQLATEKKKMAEESQTDEPTQTPPSEIPSCFVKQYTTMPNLGGNLKKYLAEFDKKLTLRTGPCLITKIH
jgi:hypothetical protein